jgi:hypothetical protein
LRTVTVVRPSAPAETAETGTARTLPDDEAAAMVRRTSSPTRLAGSFPVGLILTA